jgi:hypothetical protein
VGKTLGRILTISAAIAVNLIPGVGQALSAAIGSTLATAVVSAVTLAGLQSLGGVLGLGPSSPKPDTTVTAIKTPRPPRVSAYGISRLYFAYSLYETASNGTAVDVGAVHDGKMNALIGFYLNDDPVTLTGSTVNTGADKRYQDGTINLYWTDGSAVGTAFAAIVSLLPGVWTSNHRGDGVVMLAQTAKPVKSKKFLETYPNQVPTPSMVAQWQICPDPYAEDPSDPSGWTWTENPIRQLMHYMLVREGVDYATKIAPTIAYFQAAAGVCDAPRTLKAGGTEPRYRSWVSHKHTDSHASVKAAILETCDGWIAPRSDGALVVYAGEYIAPDVTIGPDEIVSFEWAGVGVDDDSAVNEIVCSYISADHDYNTVETDAWRNEADISARGAVLSESFEPQVPSWGQTRALAKRMEARRNAPYRGSVTTNIRGRIVRGKRYITLNLVDAGTTFYSGPAEITAITRNISTGGVTFDWVSADPNIDAWNPATEEGNPAAKGDRIASQPVATPEIDTATAILSPDGSSAQIEVVVDADDRDDLTWYLRWKVSADAVWNEAEYSDIDPGTSITLLSSVVPINASIDVAVAYQLGDGRLSEWSVTETISTSTASLAPASPTELSATGGAGEADITWRNPSSSNLSYVKLFRNTTNDLGAATDISGELVGGLGQVMSVNDTGLSAGVKYYWIVAYNAADVASTPAGPVTATVT